MTESPNHSPSHWTRAKVPSNGALIKLEEGKDKNSVGNLPKVLPSYRKRACTLGVISEQSEHKHSNDLQPRISEDDTCTKPVNTRPILNHSPPNNNCFKPVFRPTAKAGTIKALGEGMRGKFHIDDHVLAFVGVATSPTSPTSQTSLALTPEENEDENDPIQNLAIRGTDYVIVSDALTHIFALPDSISLHMASRLGDRGVQALALVQTLQQTCLDLLEQINNDKHNCEEKLKVLLVFTDEMSLCAISIIHHKLEAVMDHIQLTAATLTDEGIVWLKKNFPRVHLVQWNIDAYEQVLLERTKDACKGLLDVVVSFDCLPRALNRSVNCLKKGGTLICSEDVPENIWKNVESNLKSQSKLGLKTDFRSPVILKHLLELVSHDKIILPPMVHANNLKLLSTPKENPMRRRSYSSEE